jgi:hypothetical protein
MLLCVHITSTAEKLQHKQTTNKMIGTTTTTTTTKATADSNLKIAQDKLALNENLVYLSRVFTSVLFGVMAGMFGYTGMQGFALFLLSSLFTSVLIIMMLPKVCMCAFS